MPWFETRRNGVKNGYLFCPYTDRELLVRQGGRLHLMQPAKITTLQALSDISVPGTAQIYSLYAQKDKNGTVFFDIPDTRTWDFLQDHHNFKRL